MPRTKLLVSALALALGGATAAHAQSFSGVFTFGDSLSDAGNIAQLQGLPAGNSFTTNPDPVAAQIVAAAFGFPQTNSLAGGTNYAFGGACIQSAGPCVNQDSAGLAFTRIPNQITTYLNAHGGVADPNALYTLYGGANDIFGALGTTWLTQAQISAGATTVGLAAVGQAGRLQGLGANYIVVFNLPDLGITPRFRFLDTLAPGTAGAGTLASFTFNTALNAGLATLGDGIIPINVFGLVNEVMADPLAFGFSNFTGIACGPGSVLAVSSVACGPAGSGLPYTYAAGTNQSYFFADGVHPSGGAQAILASVVLATLAAPGEVSYAGEIPLQVYNDHSSAINQQIFGMDSAARSPGESNVYGHLQYSRQEFDADANTRGLDNNLFSGTFGADVRYSDMISLGAAVSFGSSNADNSGVSIDGKEVLLSGYGVLHMGSGYIDAIASGGSNSLDIDRSIVLGPTTRIERGNTSASHKAFELGGGFTFGSEDFHHGPFASVTWQKIKVNGYSEDSLDSTAMYFSDFDRKSTVGRLGYQVEGTTGSVQPYARVAFARDNRDHVSSVQAGSNTMNGHFTLAGFQGPKDWVEAALGFNYELSDKTDLSLAYRARLSDDTQHVNTIDFGVRMEF